MWRGGLADGELSARFCCDVMNVDEVSVQHGSASHRGAAYGCAPEVPQPARPAEGRHAKDASLRLKDRNVLGLTEASGALGDGVQHGLEVRRGAADHAQDLRGRRLLLQRLRQIAVARLELLEQAHVLDGDDGLVGEGLQQLHLGVRE